MQFIDSTPQMSKNSKTKIEKIVLNQYYRNTQQKQTQFSFNPKILNNYPLIKNSKQNYEGTGFQYLYVIASSHSFQIENLCTMYLCNQNDIQSKQLQVIRLQNRSQIKQKIQEMLHQQKHKHKERPTHYSQTLNPESEMLPPPQSFQLNNDYVFIQATKIKQKLRMINNKKYQTLSNSFKYSSIDNYENKKRKDHRNLSLNFKDIQSQSYKQKQTKNLYFQQGRLLKRVTIHRIRSQRDSIQNQTKKIQNTFNYITHAIAKKQKLQKLKYQKQSHIYNIRTQKIRNRQMCSKQREDVQKTIKIRKLELKQSVVRQKFKTQQSVKNIAQKNYLKASELKQQSQKNELIIQQRQSRLIQRNKIKYQMQKQKQKIRSQMHKHALDNKRIQARQRFKQKWLNQYQKNSKSRQHYKNEKSNIELKLKSILAKYESEQLEQLNRQTDKKNNSNNIGWKKDNNNSTRFPSNNHSSGNNYKKNYNKTSFFQELN